MHFFESEVPNARKQRSIQYVHCIASIGTGTCCSFGGSTTGFVQLVNSLISAVRDHDVRERKSGHSDMQSTPCTITVHSHRSFIKVVGGKHVQHQNDHWIRLMGTTIR
jgi:hypothetical protein